jgi:hypothetical protein
MKLPRIFIHFKYPEYIIIPIHKIALPATTRYSKFGHRNLAALQ